MEENRQKEMDYVVAQWLRYNFVLLSILQLAYLSYDIVCSWSVKWPERMEHSFESLGKWFPIGLILMRAIGQWHIHGHRRECLVRYGFPFMKGAGSIEGEIVETLWAFLNDISSAARAMSTWHRFEVLNDGINHWNWKKLIKAGEETRRRFDENSKTHCILLRTVDAACERWRKALKSYTEHCDALHKLEQSIARSPEHRALLDEYIQLMEKAEESRAYPTPDPKQRHPVQLDIYNMKEKRGHGRTETLRTCFEDEAKGRAGVPEGTAAWLDLGLRAQEEQIAVAGVARRLSRLRREPTASEMLSLAKRRSKLNRLVERFQASAPVCLPRPPRVSAPNDPNNDEEPVANHPDEVLLEGSREDQNEPTHDWDAADELADDGEGPLPPDDISTRPSRTPDAGDYLPPERIALPFPTQFSAEYREKRGWEKQVEMELRLREGRLRDFLTRLREAIAMKAFTWTNDWQNAQRQGAKTRSLDRLHSLKDTIRRECAAYDRCRKLYLDAGGFNVNDEFKELTPADVKGVRSYIDHRIRGKSKEAATWIWAGGLGEEGYVRECRCPLLLVTSCCLISLS